MENFPFKESKYDFDHILIESGYKITKEYENSITFSKCIEVDNDHSNKFSPIEPFCIHVTRPKVLSTRVKYDLRGPYSIVFVYGVIPLHAIRRIQWDTFPGELPDVLRVMLKVAEAEAEICTYNFMETDHQVIESFHKHKKNVVDN